MERGEITRVLKQARELRLLSIHCGSDPVKGTSIIMRDSVPYRIRCVLGPYITTEQVIIVLPPPPKPAEETPKPKRRSFWQRLFKPRPLSAAGQKSLTPQQLPLPPLPPETVEVYNNGWLVDGPWQEDIPRILAATERDCERARAALLERARKVVAR